MKESLKYEADIPKQFRCSLTGELMTDPVIVTSRNPSTGVLYHHHYERVAIISRLYYIKHQICHLSGCPITDNLKKLVTDEDLKAQINLFRACQAAANLKRFDPIDYILKLKKNDIEGALIFFCNYAQSYVSLLTLRHSERVVKRLCEKPALFSNINSDFRECAQAILQSLSHEHAVAVVLAMKNFNPMFLALSYVPNIIPLILAKLSNKRASAVILALNDDGMNALTAACRYVNDKIVITVVESLLAKLPDQEAAIAIRQTDRVGWNALMVACRNVHEEFVPTVIASLLARLSDQDAAVVILQSNSEGWNSLRMACTRAPSAVGLLLARLSDQDAATAILHPNNKGRNVLMAVTGRKHMSKELQLSILGSILARLSDQDAATAILQLNSEGWNVLMVACEIVPDAVEMLLGKLSDQQATAAILQLNEDGWNALHLICRHAPPEVITDVVVSLLARLSDQNAAAAILQLNKTGMNVLLLACRHAPPEVMFILLKKLSAEQRASAVLSVIPEQRHFTTVVFTYRKALNAVNRLVKLSAERLAKELSANDEKTLDFYLYGNFLCMFAPSVIEPVLATLLAEPSATILRGANLFHPFEQSMLDCKRALNFMDVQKEKSLSEQVAIAILTLNQDRWNKWVLDYKIDPQTVHALFPTLTPELVEKAILESLKVFCRYIPKVLPLLLAKLSPKKRAEAILAVNERRYNMLIYACLSAHEALEPLLDALSTDEAAEGILALTEDGQNTLMAACQYNPTKIEYILAKLTPEQINIAMHAESKGWNALMLACRFAPDAVELLLAKLSPEEAVAQCPDALEVAKEHSPSLVPVLESMLNTQLGMTQSMYGLS